MKGKAMEFKATVVAKDGSMITLPATFSSTDGAWTAVRANAVKRGLELWFPRGVARMVRNRPVVRRNWAVRDIHRPLDGKTSAAETVAVAFVYPADADPAVVDEQIKETSGTIFES